MPGKASVVFLNFNAYYLFYFRIIVKATSVEKLVSDSRYMADANLTAFVSALIGIIEGLDEEKPNSPNSAAVAPGNVLSGAVKSSYSLLATTPKIAKFKSISHSSVAWLEMLVVDVALRNRDRFVLIWPILELHYTRTLCVVSSISYLHERRIVGLLKIATRMISRYNLSESLIRLLGCVFIRAEEHAVSSRSLLRTLRETSVTVRPKHPVGLSNQVKLLLVCVAME